MGFRHTLSAAALGLACLPAGAFAALVTLTAPGDLSAGSTLIDFDDLADHAAVNTAYAARGVSFSRPDGENVAVLDVSSTPGYAHSGANVLATVSGTIGGVTVASWSTVLDLRFTSATSEIGTYFGNDPLDLDITLSLFDGAGALIGSHTWGGDGNNFADQFIGLRSDMPFLGASFSVSHRGRAVVLDDLMFVSEPREIPSPPTALLLAAGLAAAIGLRPRRPRRA